MFENTDVWYMLLNLAKLGVFFVAFAAIYALVVRSD